MTATSPSSARVPHSAPLSEMSFWTATFDDREEVFRELRRDAPISWHPPFKDSMQASEEGAGYWAAVTHADVVAISGDSETFSSGIGGVQFEEVPANFAEQASSFIALDDPRHAKLRKLVSTAFTPKRIARFQTAIDGRARWIVDRLIETGDCDFVANIALQMPMWAISELVGIPEEQRESVAHSADVEASGGHDPDLAGGLDPISAVFKAIGHVRGVGIGLAEARRWYPQDDLMTGIVQAEVDGEKLTDNEIGAFFNLLAIAGNDTTRNTLSHTLLALSQFPDQRRLLLEDFDGRIDAAMEEFVRWATPVETFRRTATRDTELSGVPIAKGDKVVMFYGSANRDETVFDNPHVFDITRTPNNHVGFGGGGAHFCMGSMLAKAQIKTLLRELFSRVPDIEVADPKYMTNPFVHGVTSMPCTLNL